MYDDDVRTKYGQWKKQAVVHSGPIWISGNGKEHLIRDMETSHIINCILTVGRRKAELVEITSSLSLDVNNYAHDVITEQINIWEESLRAFYDELYRRGEARAIREARDARRMRT